MTLFMDTKKSFITKCPLHFLLKSHLSCNKIYLSLIHILLFTYFKKIKDVLKLTGKQIHNIVTLVLKKSYCSVQQHI